MEPLYSLIPQGYLGHSTPCFDFYPQADPERARELMEEAGVDLPLHITFAHRDDDANKGVHRALSWI